MRFGVVIGTQRSGTTVLRDFLSTHPKVKTHGEIFLNRHQDEEDCYFYFLKKRVLDDPRLVVPSKKNNDQLYNEFLDYLTKLDPTNEDKEMLTFDCKYSLLLGAIAAGELNWTQRPYLLQAMFNHSTRIIHIVRKNVLATITSSLLSVKNQLWATDDLSRVKHRSVEVDPDQLLKAIKHREAEIAHFSSMLEREGALEVCYEDIIVDGVFTQQFADRVAQHLGLSGRFALEPKLKKIAPPLDQSIENFSEVAQLLGSTEYEWMLSE